MDQLEMAAAICASLPDAAVLFDAKFGLIAYNRALLEFLDMRPRVLKQVLGASSRPFDALGNPTHQDIAQQCITKGSVIRLHEVEIHTPEGEARTAIVTFIPVGGTEPAAGLLYTVRDVSAEARMQRHYKELLTAERARADELEARVRERTKELTAALHELRSFGNQLRNFTAVLREVHSVSDLSLVMNEGLKFLAVKYGARVVFVPDLAKPDISTTVDPEQWDTMDLLDGSAPVISNDSSEAFSRAHGVLVDSHARGTPMLTVLAGKDLGLSERTHLIPFEVTLDMSEEDREETIQGGIYIEFYEDTGDQTKIKDFHSDVGLFLENWIMSYRSLELQERVANERMLREQMYYERFESLANMVTGLAHEINTPLGVANTANSMINRIAGQLQSAEPGSDDAKELVKDLGDVCEMMTRNITRAHNLIKSFKQLSSSQLTDERAEVDLASVIQDCLDTMAPELRQRSIKAFTHHEGETFPWEGYPGHLYQVLVNFVQNTLRYAYADGSEGNIDLRILKREEQQIYRIEFQDYGSGVSPEILPRIFEPFVTSGRGRGGTGLGLAISHNIVVNLLKGKIQCFSTVDEGTKFVLDIPYTVPEADGAAQTPDMQAPASTSPNETRAS